LQARIPVWFGGSATDATARRVTEIGDGWSPIGNTPPSEVAEGVKLIREHCSRIGRDPDSIRVRCSLPLRTGSSGRGDIYATVDSARAYAEAGATIVQLPPLARFVDDRSEVAALLLAARDALSRLTGGS
jgi:alkanesulfonate monooxygenase SsuD/methylene tetrahydromethanopterin reductase-like flavin-dependent oxidoreductase (luciferase family)